MIKKYEGAWGDKQITHLLRRTLFSYTKEDLNLFRGMNMEEAVNLLLSEEDFPADPPINNYEVLQHDPDIPKGESWVDAVPSWAQDPPAPEVHGPRTLSLTAWLVKNFIQQKPRLHHKLWFFWHNHLATSVGIVGTAKKSYRYVQMLWNNSYGNFKDLIYEITVDPAMLVYLNGTANIKEAPDENFARELQELFCIGKGPNANFTESDVQEAARVLTGWGVDWDTVQAVGPAQSRFYDFQHTTRDKQFSSFYNNRVIQGRSGSNGESELDDLIDMIVEHPECARFICRKLYRFFVHNEIDDTIETEVIEPLAEKFISSNYEIAPVLEDLFTSEQFFNEDIMGAMIKGPMDAMIGVWKSLEVQYLEEGDPIDEDFWIHLMMTYAMDAMGLFLLEPPSVSGWPAYYQIPSYDKLWITTFSIISRIIVTDELIHAGFWTPTRRTPWDYLTFTETFDNPGNLNALIDEAYLRFMAMPPTNEIRSRLRAVILSGQNTNSYWTGAWADYISDRSNTTYRNTVLVRLREFYVVLFQLPEFQLI